MCHTDRDRSGRVPKGSTSCYTDQFRVLVVLSFFYLTERKLRKESQVKPVTLDSKCDSVRWDEIQPEVKCVACWKCVVSCLLEVCSLEVCFKLFA